MTAVKQYFLHCDHGGCQDWIRCAEYVTGRGHDKASTTLAEARRWARKRGWVTRDGRDYCPRHKP